MVYDIVIIGGGIVGLASALKIKQSSPNLKVILLEKENKLAAHQTGNNSGVIHSGLYYKPGSLKAKNCVEGYHMLIDFCDKNDIPYDICGKVVVATNKKQIATLEMLHQRGIENGLDGIKKITKNQIKEYEPYCEGVEGLFVPQTGIVDYSIVSLKYAEEFKKLGGEIKLDTKVTEIRTSNAQIDVVANNSIVFSSKLIVNCAGLYSDKITKMTGVDPNYRILPFRGEYFKLKKSREYLVKNLIYPVPDPQFPFLGVHFTRMQKGGIEAGPNAVLAYSREGYRKTDIHLRELAESLGYSGFRKIVSAYWKTGISEFYRSYSKSAFAKALQKLIPDIQEDDLTPGGAGVRAQACTRDGKLVDDFLIIESDHAINIGNAPSPAATSSLSIGKSVSELALKRF